MAGVRNGLFRYVAMLRRVVEFVCAYVYFYCERPHEMKSKVRTIEVSKAINIGTMPMFIQMIHRHFEKENPAEAFSVGQVKTYRAPVDLLRLTVSDPTLTSDVEEVTFTYGKRS